jgi:Fe-S cluster biosynthesis and repair protein YggX
MARAYWKIIADEISRDGWCWGMTQAILNGKRLFVVDAHQGRLLPRYVVRADTLLGFFWS